MSDNCIFCKIIKGRIPSAIVHRDEEVVAFRDLNPQAPVHLLIVPVKHVDSVAEPSVVEGDLLTSVFGVAQKLATEHKLEKGFRIVVNCGADGGQTVSHLHFHLLGQRQLGWPPG